MKADPQTQRHLLEIADLDKAVAQARHRSETLPEHRSLAEHASRRRELSAQIVAVTTRISDAEAESDRIEADLEPARARLARNQARIDDGSIGQKELAPLIEEVEHLKGRINTLEDAQLDLMQTLEDENTQLAEYTAAREDTETHMRELMASRDTAVEQITAEIETLTASRDSLVSAIPDALMRVYERVGAALGSGAAELKGSYCGGCALELDADTIRTVESAAVDDVITCPECGRILVRA